MNDKNIFSEIDDGVDVLPVAKLPAVSKTPRFEITEAEQGLAAALDLSLDGDVRHLVGVATAATNQALTLVIESGLLLIAAHDQIVFSERSEKTSPNGGRPKNDEFRAVLDEFGLPYQRAYEAMSMAKYAANLPADQRTEMLALPKTKVMLLAQADPEVIADLFADEQTDIKDLSVRGLKNQIRELKAAKAQSSVEVQKAQAEKTKLEKQLAAATATRADMTDIVPPHVSDIRLEAAALYKKAELSIDGIARLIHEAHMLDGEWALSTARSIFAALTSLIAQAKGPSAELHKAYGANLDGDHSTLERLTQKELFKCATEFRELIGEHEHEAALRAYERDLDKPKGKGRPKAAPTKD